MFPVLLDTPYGKIFVCLLKYSIFRHLVSFPYEADCSVAVRFSALLPGHPKQRFFSCGFQVSPIFLILKAV